MLYKLKKSIEFLKNMSEVINDSSVNLRIVLFLLIILVPCYRFESFLGSIGW